MPVTRRSTRPSPSVPSSRATACAAVACLLAHVVPSVALGQANPPQVSEAVAGMASGDRERAMAGRQALIARLSGMSRDPAGLAKYAADVAAALGPVVNGKDPHAKLNAAIVVHRIAEVSNATALADVTARLVADPSPAVSVYGLRAASKVLPRLLADPALPGATGDLPIVRAIVGSVTEHPESEAVAFEAYYCVVRVLLDRSAAEELTPAGVAAATPRAVEIIHRLIAARLPLFGTGTLSEPAADGQGVNFMGRQNTWGASSKEQQTRTLSLLLQLMSAAADEMNVVPASTVSTRPRLEALRNLVKTSGGSLSVLADIMQKPALRATAQETQKLGLATVVTEYRRVIDQIRNDFYNAMPELRPSTTQPGSTSRPATRSTAAAAR